jgi:hypothetical protein
MNKKVHIVMATLIVSALMLAGPVPAQKAPDVLKAGQYSAKVKAIVCGGCVPLIQKTLQTFKEIEAVTVDQKSSSVQFAVKKDTTVKMADIQKALDTAANQMKMGADYTLSDIKTK